MSAITPSSVASRKNLAEISIIASRGIQAQKFLPMLHGIRFLIECMLKNAIMPLSKTDRWSSLTMRKLIVCNIISLDGFFSGSNGNVMAMPFDNGFSDYNAERLRAADTLLLGRKTFEGFRNYLPAIAEDVSQPALEREISRLNTAIEKVVVSNSLKHDEVEGWGTCGRSNPHNSGGGISGRRK